MFFTSYFIVSFRDGYLTQFSYYIYNDDDSKVNHFLTVDQKIFDSYLDFWLPRMYNTRHPIYQFYFQKGSVLN